MPQERSPLQAVYVRADRLMLLTVWCLFALSLALASQFSTWGEALVVGGGLALGFTALALGAPGALVTRLAAGATLMAMTGLHIHQAMGQSELHFGVFVLLAFLLAYRDWRPIVAGAAVIALHHLSFNYLQIADAGVYCFTKPGLVIVLTHATYVVLESAILAILALQLRRESVQAAEVGHMVSDLNHDGRIRLRQVGAPKSPLGQNFQTTTSLLSSAVRHVVEAGHEVGVAASEIASGNQDLSRRTEAQAQSVQQVANAMEDLARTIRQTVDDAGKASIRSLEVSQSTVAAGNLVEQVVVKMAALSASAGKMTDIISAIDGIAFQTNILALNASVEAARAGEQGRGFAVVASEVRELAQRSARASAEIRGLIAESVRQVQGSVELVGTAGATMREIVSSVADVTQLIGTVSDQTGRQGAAVEQVNQSVAQIDATTQQNSALVEQAAAASMSLDQQARKLEEVVALFQLDATPA